MKSSNISVKKPDLLNFACLNQVCKIDYRKPYPPPSLWLHLLSVRRWWLCYVVVDSMSIVVAAFVVGFFVCLVIYNIIVKQCV